MKKIFGIALVLAVLTSLCFGSVALADDPPEVTVNFNVTDPNITVTAYKPAGVNEWEGTAQFTLTGSSHATGSVTASLNGVIQSSTDFTGQPTVSGGYTASGGDFQSTFSAYSYMTRDNCPKHNDYGHWSTHSIDATGVTDGSMTVNGSATALAWPTGWSFGGFVEGQQTFSGDAEVVEVFGENVWATKKGDVGWGSVTTFHGAQFTATVTASSTTSFNGGTEAGTYPVGTETGPGRVLSKQGLGFDVYATGTSIAEVWVSDYAYNIIDTFTNPSGVGVVGESSTWFTGSDGPGWNEWTGIPGYIAP